MWSFGIIVYMMLGVFFTNEICIYHVPCLMYFDNKLSTCTLLGGYYPFFDEKPEKLTELIISGEWDFHAEYWGLVSSEAKDFISKLLKSKLHINVSLLINNV